MIAFVYLCVMIVLIFSLKSILSGVCNVSWRTCFSGLMCLIIGLIASFVPIMETTNDYIHAEPLAYNQTQTVFTTEEGTYLVDGLYPDGIYLLTVDGEDVLVVWQAVDGKVG